MAIAELMYMNCPIKTVLIMFFAASLCAFFGYVWLLQYNAAEQEALAVTSIPRLLGVANSLVMGTVVSVDTARNSLTISRPDPYGSQSPEQIVFAVQPYTYIAYQELIADRDGVYAALSEPRKASLADIAPGMRVEIGVVTLREALGASVVIFGNPL